MLDRLPSEIIVNLTVYIPSLKSLTSLSQTCRRLHAIFTAEESAIFRTFVLNRFGQTPTPPFWKDAACALAARSRALDRLGLIGRFVPPSENAIRIGTREAYRLDNPTLGYKPSIDSYEVWNGESWADRKEVLAWGAGHQLVMRTKQSGKEAEEKWIVFNDADHPTSYDDICGLHLLEPEKNGKGMDIENVIFGRCRGELLHVALSPEDASVEYKNVFNTHGLLLDRTDLCGNTLTAHLDDGSIAFYKTGGEKKDVEPFETVREEEGASSRKRYSKLLSRDRVAISEAKLSNSLVVSTIAPDGLHHERELSIKFLDPEEELRASPHASVSAIAPLNTHTLSGAPGDVFIAAWGDRTIRLHDLRSPHSFEGTYRDSVDLSLIYTVHPFSHDRFLAGASGDAVLKIFDLRMTNAYNYLEAQIPATSPTNGKPRERNMNFGPSKDFSLFLSAHPGAVTPRQFSRAQQGGAYRGAIYAMSSPSPSSPTVYTGVTDGVVRLDFASTDDLTGSAQSWYDYNLDLGVEKGQPSVPVDTKNVLQMAGYERPHPDDVTITSKLRKQHGSWYPESKFINNEVVTGWDRRWEPQEKPGAWRRPANR